LAMFAGIPLLVLVVARQADPGSPLVALMWLGLAVGIWSLLLLRRPSSRTAFQIAQSNATALGLPGAVRLRRLRRAALLGAILFPSAVMAALIIYTTPPPSL